MGLWLLALVPFTVVGTDAYDENKDVWKAAEGFSSYYLVKGDYVRENVTCVHMNITARDPGRHHVIMNSAYVQNGKKYDVVAHGYALNATERGSGQVERHILRISSAEECDIIDPEKGDTHRLLYSDGKGCFVLRPRERDTAIEKSECEMWIEESKVRNVPQGCNDSYASQCPGTKLSTYDKNCTVELPYSSESTPPEFTSACKGTKR